MSRRMVSILGAAAALFAVSAPAASAAEAAALPYCYGATYGANTVQICAAEDTGIGNGTVDPELSTDCIIKIPAVTLALDTSIVTPVVSPCRLVGQVVSGIESTGFTPSGAPLYGPTIVGLSVRWQGYHVGTLYVDGATTPLRTESLCVGGGCPSAMDTALQLVNAIATK